jgi:hypothetical protein
MANALAIDQDLTDNKSGDVTPEPKAPPKPTKSNSTAKPAPKRPNMRAAARAVEKMAEESNHEDAEDDMRADTRDEPVKKGTRKEEKSSKSEGKDGKADTDRHTDTNTEVQHNKQTPKIPTEFSVTDAILTDKANLNSKSKNNVQCIARRRKYKRDYLEMLVWDESGVEWLRRTVTQIYYKGALDDYDRARVEERVHEVTKAGWYHMELLESVRLIDENDDRGARSPSSSTSQGEFISHYSDNDYELARQMLIYILREALPLSEWAVSTKGVGSYQFATDQDRVRATSWGAQNASDLVQELCQVQINGGERYEEAKRILGEVDVVWTHELDGDRMVVDEGNEPQSPPPPDTRSRIKLMQLWTTFVNYFDVWQRKSSDGSFPDRRSEKILPPTPTGRRELGRSMIHSSPHITSSDSWPYLLVLALLPEEGVEAAELEVGLAPSKTRLSNVVHSCMIKYQAETHMDYPQAVHVFWLLQQSLQEEKPRDATRCAENSGEDSDSEDDQDGGSAGDDRGAPSDEKGHSSTNKKQTT